MTQEDNELPLLSKPRSPYFFIDQEQALNEAVGNLEAGIGPIAVDAERASGFKYNQDAYLIQVHRVGSPIYLIDPKAFAINAVEQFMTLMNSNEWILHAATQDLPCLNDLGLHPKAIFDTEHISRLLGFPRVGLGPICELAIGMRLAKEHSAADWSTRPLPESWLDYAALDVDVLPAIREFLLSEIESQDKAELVRQDMSHLLGFKRKPEKVDRWRGLKNLHLVKDQNGLAVAKHLWEAREKLAAEKDTSPGRILPDSSIVAVSQDIPKTKSQLAGMKTFVGRGSRSFLDLWWRSIESGLKMNPAPPLRLPATGIPNHRNWEKHFPVAHARYQSSKTFIAEVSESTKIPAENLLQPDLLRELCFDEALLSANQISTFLLSKTARPWQVELLAEGLAKAFASHEEP